MQMYGKFQGFPSFHRTYIGFAPSVLKVEKLEGIFKAIDDGGDGMITEERLTYLVVVCCLGGTRRFHPGVSFTGGSLKPKPICLDLDPPRGAKWMVRGATKQSLRVQTPPLGGCWDLLFLCVRVCFFFDF